MDYAPDQPLRTPDVLMDVSNLVPDVSGNYVTAPVTFECQSLTSTGSSDYVLAAAAFRHPTGGGINTFVTGTQKGLFAGAYGNAGGKYSTTTFNLGVNDSWCFASFGVNSSGESIVLAANGTSVLQATTGLGSTTFGDVTSSPSANIIFEHQNAIVALNISGNSDGWACSDTGDYRTWTPAAGNFADSGDLFGGVDGALTAGTTWEKWAIAFKSNAMYLGERVEEIDQAIHWERVGDFIGCAGLNGWIKTELGLIFVSMNDILLYDGSKPRSIADPKTRREFNRRIPTKRERIFLTHDDREKNIYFWYNGSASDIWADSAFVFNYKSGKWGKVNTIQTNGTSYIQARCPVKNAVGPLFYATTATGPGGTQNLEGSGFGSNQFVVHNGGSNILAAFNYRATNSSGSAITRDSTNGKPSFTTGYIGQHDVDSTLGRFWVVTESFGRDTTDAASGSNTLPESATVTVIQDDLSTRPAGNAKISATGMIDCVEQGRYFQVKPTWPTSVHRQTISIMQPEFIRQSKGR